MKQLTIILSIWLLAGVAIAESPSNYSGLPEGYVPAHGNPADLNMVGQGRDLTFYENMEEFMATYPEIAANPECFDNTNVAPGEIEMCAGPFSSATDNACYSPGALIDGFTLDSFPLEGANVAIGVGALGNESVWVGPNNFDEHSKIQYDPAVDTVAMLFQLPQSPATLSVEIYGEGGELGLVEIEAGMDTFLGISSTEPISYIRVLGEGAAAELYDCIWFGNGAVANESATWTMMKSIYR